MYGAFFPLHLLQGETAVAAESPLLSSGEEIDHGTIGQWT